MQVDSLGSTPLMDACFQGNIESCRVLLKYYKDNDKLDEILVVDKNGINSVILEIDYLKN